MRYDNFIIWGNGIDFVPQIIDMIRKDKNFDIVMMKTFHIDNMEEFVKTIYGCDPYPWEHLVAKTRYLLKSPPQIVFVLVKNKNPKEIIKDKGDFEHVECTNVVNLKIKIRNTYNPKFVDPSRRISPLEAGVSHEHCIHGSDTEKQTEYILKILELKSLNYYKRYDDSEYYFPYHLDIDSYKVVDRNLNSLSANIIGKGIVTLEKTPHFQYLNGKTEEYIQYFYNNFGTSLCEDHFPESFDKLIQNFDPNYVREDGKKSHIIIDRNNVILDGVHRAVLLKAKNVTQVNCLQIETHAMCTSNLLTHANAYSNLIDLQDYFKNCPYEYCVIKMNEHFPNYFSHSDVDILCTDIQAMVAYTKEWSRKYEDRHMKFHVNALEQGHVHIDVYSEGQSLDFKFDFIDNLNTYRSFSVNSALMTEIIRNKIVRENVFVPSSIYDLALRYIEFVEYDKDRPDKIKHYEYVNQYPEYIDNMLDIIKRYTSIMKKPTEKIENGSGDRKEVGKELCQTPISSRFYPITETCQVPMLSLIYEQYFGKRTDGIFVEVGAFDGEYVSNTSGLSDIGWSGLYFEPVPSFFEKCQARHAKNKNVRVVNIAIGDHTGVVPIHIGGPLSTVSKDMQENFKCLDWAKKCFQEESTHLVNLETLENIFLEYKVSPGFELLVVDVEGFEWNVLKGFDVVHWKPQMVIVELHDQNDDYFSIREACKNIVEYFDKADYKVIWKDFTNTIYVPKDRYPLPIEER